MVYNGTISSRKCQFNLILNMLRLYLCPSKNTHVGHSISRPVRIIKMTKRCSPIKSQIQSLLKTAKCALKKIIFIQLNECTIFMAKNGISKFSQLYYSCTLICIYFTRVVYTDSCTGHVNEAFTTRCSGTGDACFIVTDPCIPPLNLHIDLRYTKQSRILRSFVFRIMQ